MVSSVSEMKSGMYITVGRDPTLKSFSLSFASITQSSPTSQLSLICKTPKKKKIRILIKAKEKNKKKQNHEEADELLMDCDY